jgi:16S rRNA (adenine1518-N6/adenine1519-N6)-dimethyltransferase
VDVALLGPADVRSLASSLGIRPTKRLGQNFVHDANTVRRIVAAAGLSPDDIVLEVGPGLGSLTLALLPVVRSVVAVEIDPVLAARLPLTVAERAPDLVDRLRVVTANALTVPADDLAHVRTGTATADPTAQAATAPTGSSGPTALVANLPYNVAVPVVLRLLADLPTLGRGLVMVQAEVADRLAAGPGSRTYGIPSVKAAWYADVRRAGMVSRSVFWPAPNVDSALVSFVRRPPPAEGTKDIVFSLVDAAFAQRRKTLRAALAGWAGSAAAAGSLLAAAGIPATERGEQLGVREFAHLAEAAVATGVRTP